VPVACPRYNARAVAPLDLIGQPVLRREDARFLVGGGRYVSDIPIDGALSLVVVRSPHAHARVTRIDLDEARRVPGVLGAYRLDDLPELRGALPPPVVPAVTVKPYRQSALADGVVRFAGEPVVAIVATDAYRATDAAGAMRIEYEPLAAVIDPIRAAEVPIVLVHPEWDTNVAATVTIDTGDVDAAMRRAHLVITRRIRCGRVTALPMEPRAVLARWDAAASSVHVWSSTQMPYAVRQRIADALALSPEAVRVTAPDVGGGFGTKGPVYPEEVLAAALARRLGRPVRWTDTRQDSFVSTTHAGDQHHEVTLALAADGEILALADDFVIDAGAYLPRGAVVANVTATHLVGLYRVPAFRCRGRVVVTHKVPCAPYRGAGRPQATFVGERILDIAARELGVDPIALRRRNLIRADEMPYRRAIPYRDGAPMVHDSGDYPNLLDSALAKAGYAGFRERQRAARREGRRLGLGVAAYNEATAIGPQEGATIDIDERGRVQVIVGAPSQGQGHETVLAQVCADRLGVPLAIIDVTAGDTARFPSSMGTYASRIAVLVGNAVALAADAVRDRICRVASHALECDADDVAITDGRAHVKGFEDRGLSLADVLALSKRPDVVGEPGLAATRYFNPESVTWAAGVHVATVAVDPETGRVDVLGYHAVHDAGHEINPLIVEGQTQGGAVQGIGAALSEAIVYDDAGQPLTATLMEYGLPRADSVPGIDVAGADSPSPMNPLHLKGTGEGSAVPGPAAIANAVADALGIELTECPVRAQWLVRSEVRSCPTSATI
jgi:CO/xanthine dehydrogenase Mo-binding subunit